MFEYLLYFSLTVFVLGLIYKVSTWFTRKIGLHGNKFTTTQRVRSAAQGLIHTIFSSKIIALFEALVLDVMLQRRTLKESFIRWLGHMFIFYGFLLLLLMHGLQGVVTESVFSDYYSTLNPFLFLRDFFAALVLAGVLLAAIRRYLAKPRRLRTGGMDHYAVMIVAVIILSGISLEGLKITSHDEFERMVEDYGLLDDEDEIRALETLWVKDYGLVSPDVKAPFDAELIQSGREVHESSCVDCHASAKWAFNGFVTAKLIKPAALWLDQKNGITVIEDACQAHGARYKNKKAGSIGSSGCFSFYPGKNLGAFGEGGAVVTQDKKVAQKIRMIRDHGQKKKYFHDLEGYNGRLDAIQAGVLRIKLKRLNQWNRARRKNVGYYNELLSDIPSITLLKEAEFSYSVYHLYVILLDDRDGLQKFLDSKGISTGLHYPLPLHLQKAYQHLGYKKGDFPVTEHIAKRLLSLPMFPELTREQIKYVVDSIKEFIFHQ